MGYESEVARRRAERLAELGRMRACVNAKDADMCMMLFGTTDLEVAGRRVDEQERDGEMAERGAAELDATCRHRVSYDWASGETVMWREDGGRLVRCVMRDGDAAAAERRVDSVFSDGRMLATLSRDVAEEGVSA